MKYQTYSKMAYFPSSHVTMFKTCATVIVIFLAMAVSYGLGSELSCGIPLTFYNVSTHLCCGGEVIRKLTDDGQELGCCDSFDGRHLYNKNTEICCGPFILPIQDENGRTRHCCKQFPSDRMDDHIYFKEDSICCWGKVHNKIDGRCCGRQTYNDTSNICCQATDTHKIHIQERSVLREACCGLKVYDEMNEVCNGEKTKSTSIIKSLLDTCNGENYHVMRQQCFNGKLFPVNWVACNGEYIDPDKQRCCPADTDYDSPEFCAPRNHRCCGNTSISMHDERKECCRNVVHDVKKNHKCCDRKLVDDSQTVCCQNEALDKLTADCCGGKKYEKNTKAVSCCADKIINTANQLCCSVTSQMKEPVLKKKRNDTMCCGLTPYCNHDEECTANGVVKKPKAAKNVPVVDAPAAIGRKAKGAVAKNARTAKAGDRLHPDRCTHCGRQKNAQFGNYMNKKYVHYLTIGNITRPYKRGVMINATLRHPLAGKDSAHIVLRTRHNCKCFKPGKEYMLITNRKLGINPVQRFNEKDLLVRNSKRVRQLIRNACAVVNKLNQGIMQGQTLKSMARNKKLSDIKKPRRLGVLCRPKG